MSLLGGAVAGMGLKRAIEVQLSPRDRISPKVDPD